MGTRGPKRQQNPICNTCGVKLDESNWWPSQQIKLHRHLQCINCMKKVITNYYRNNKEKVLQLSSKWRKANKEKAKLYDFRHYHKLRLLVLQHYSPKLTCQKCGFNEVRVLTIDHVNGDGASDRKASGRVSGSFYQWLKTSNYPIGYQVLCMNCQWIKRYENHEGMRIQWDKERLRIFNQFSMERIVT